ncbi:MAG: CusA/CzcA family heavy metal efflux RND transporter [Bacteroidota bacterium]|nr:CusA/CzcA family heavy metal efflux RND transporter [Bacteroidota bacterium]
MIDRIIRFSVKQKPVIIFFVLGLIAWGIYSLVHLPMDALPDITDNQVQVHAIAPALDAQDVEQMITSPLELSMANIPGLKEIRSVSRFGLSVITVVFNENVSTYLARELVFQRIQEARGQIPAGVADISMAPIATGLGEIYQYVLQPAPGFEHKYSLTQLRTMEDWIVKRQLEGTPGVAEINSFGGYIKQYEVAADPTKMRSMNVTISEIFTALEKNNQNTGGAYIEKENNAYFIRGVGLVKTLDDIGKIVVKNNQGIPVLIRDVAKVQFGHAVRYGAMTESGHGETVGGVVLMLKGANSMEVIKNVKAKMAVIQKSLPAGIVIKPFIDRSKLISRAVHTISHNLIEGGLIVIFILVLFLGNWRAGIVVASVIPLSMLFAFGMMHLFGVSGNLMSLGAIDFGMIVDGAIIIVESVVFYIHQRGMSAGSERLNQTKMDEIVFSSATQIRKSAAFGEIIILIVYIPIFTLVGVEGRMFRPMAETVSFAISGALLLSLTYVPAMSALFLSKKIALKKTLADRIMDFIQRIYSPVIHFALRRKLLIITTSVILCVAAGFTFMRLGGQFIPTLEEGDFSVEMHLMPGTALSQTIRTTIMAEKILNSNFPEVKNVVTRIGVASIPTDPDPIETAMFMIILKDKSHWQTTDNYDGLATKMKEALSVIPGASFEFSQPIQQRENELMTGIKQDVAVKIYGDDLDELSQLGDQATSIISAVPGAQDVLKDNTNGLPEITVRYNRDKISEYGLTISDINKVLESAFAGSKAGIVYENDRRFDLVVRLDSTYRNKPGEVQHLFISLPNGQQVPLSDVADITLQSSPALISRDNTKRRIAIGFNVRNRDVQSVVKDIKEQLGSKLNLPPGYFITYGGQFQNLVAAKKRLGIVVPMALAIIFALLFFTFGSLKETLLIFTGIPFAAIGGIFALFARGMPFSISAGVGFIALFGVAVLNGIVLVSYFNQLQKQGTSNVLRCILLGTHRRLRPVLMTASVASLGFLPMALSATAGAEVQRPLATVVIGGLITSTILTLIVLPVLYKIFTGNTRRRKRPGDKGRALLLLCWLSLLVPVAGNSQQPVLGTSGVKPLKLSLEEAIKLAMQNYPGIKTAKYEVQQQKILKKSAFDLDKTSFIYTTDNTSPLRNTYLGVQQTFRFPTVYVKQGRLQSQEVALSKRSLEITKAELLRNVRSAYYQIAYDNSRLELLTNQDSIYSGFAKAAEVRYKTGETTYLEKVTADAKYHDVHLLVKQSKADQQIDEQELQKWVNVPQAVQVKDSLEKLGSLENPDSLVSGQNPVLDYYAQNIRVAQAQLSLERSGLLPDFIIGYNKQTANGTGGYRGYEMGINIPLWFKSRRARIQAAGIGVNMAQADYDNFKSNIMTAYQQQFQQYRKWEEQLNYYEKTGINQSEEILHTAGQQYKSGNISYVEYIQDVTEAFTIKLGYLDALNHYNQTIIIIDYLIGK